FRYRVAMEIAKSEGSILNWLKWKNTLPTLQTSELPTVIATAQSPPDGEDAELSDLDSEEQSLALSEDECSEIELEEEDQSVEGIEEPVPPPGQTSPDQLLGIEDSDEEEEDNSNVVASNVRSGYNLRIRKTRRPKT